MIQPHRKIHRYVFFVLALLLPALFLSGIAFRYVGVCGGISRHVGCRP
jgi:hypothetical protein